MNILDEYVMKPPSHRNAVDLFAGEWVSKIPIDVASGPKGLFEDARITQLARAAGGLEGKRVLELGPLEAAHTAMMLDLGALEVLAVEANSRAFMRCLVVKEILGLERARFVLGDFNEMLPTDQPFDFILASGVLYHAANPVKTLIGLTQSADTIGIWSHYYVEAKVRERQGNHFTHQAVRIEHDGLEAICYEKRYGAALGKIGYCGGGNEFAFWMDRPSWFSVFDALGFDLEILNESLDHPNGPQFTAIARRR